MIPQMTQDLWTQKRINILAALLAFVGLVGAGWFGYTWYMRSQEQKAYKDLAESTDAYVKVRAGGGKAEKWADVARDFEVGAQRNPSSKLQPYFLVFQADALLEQGKQKEAIALMDKAVGLLPRSNPLYYLYAAKRALIKIDSSEEETKKIGRQELTALAKDAANPMQDMARYYSGLDALQTGDKAAAQSFFREISPSGEHTSFWYQIAQEKLSEL